MVQIMPFQDAPTYRFNPAHFVPGIGPSPDKMLQGRLFGDGDTHRYRLGVNHHQIPVNAAHAAPVANYQRDGAVRVDGNRGGSKNYEPNSFNGPAQTARALYHRAADRRGRRHVPVAPARGGLGLRPGRDLYRLIDEDAKVRLVKAIGGSLSKVSAGRRHRACRIERRRGGPEVGARVEAEVKKLRASVQQNDPAHESAIILPDEKA